jgi:hypothetical protein
MRKALLTQILSAVAVIGAHGQNLSAEHPVFDSEGHYIAYVYADGKRDLYWYDAKWRMVMFTSREGKTTKYVYDPDGTMHVIPPDGVPFANGASLGGTCQSGLLV